MRIASRWLMSPLVQRELRKLFDPGYLREHGGVITQLRALEGHAPAIGTYMGREMARGDFHGHGVPSTRALQPGLIYVTN